MAKNGQKSGSKFKKMAQQNLIVENGGKRKINPSANPVTEIYYDPHNACYQIYTNCSFPWNKLVAIIVSISKLKRLQSFSKSA